MEANKKKKIGESPTSNDLYDTTCMTHNQLSDFHCVYIIRVFSLQEFKKNDSRTNCSSSNYYTNFRERQVKEKETKKKCRYDYKNYLRMAFENFEGIF